MNYIEIKDRLNKNYLAISLYDLLTTISTIGEKYNWSIYELTAVGNEKNDLNIPEFEQKIFNSPKGFHLSWKELLKLAESFDQVIDLILVASPNKNDFSEFENSNKWRDKYPILIEILDGFCWNVHSPAKELIDFLASKYQDTKIYFQN